MVANLNGAALCTGKSKRTGKSCKRIALLGTDLCEFHGGHQRRKAMLVPVSISPRGSMLRYESEHLGPTVKAFVQRELDCDPREQLGLYEELAHLRYVLAKSIDEYHKALEVDIPDGEEGLEDRNLLLRAKILLQGDVDKVAAIASKCSTIDNNGADKFSIHTFNAIINQIIRICSDVVGEDKLPLLVAAIEAEVRMPTGTEQIVDAGVSEAEMQRMLGSVPAKEAPTNGKP